MDNARSGASEFPEFQAPGARWAWEPQTECEAWAGRNSHWLKQSARPARRAARERQREPLILCGRGVSLSVDKGTLLVRDGFTHWPQERAEYRLFKGSLDLPPRIVVIDGEGSLSFDAISWLSEQSIPLVRLDYRGEVVSVIGGPAFAIDRERVRWQVQTRADPVSRAAFCSDLIAKKLVNSLTTLRSVVPASRARDVAEARAEAGIQALRSGALTDVDQIRIVEATAAAAYFGSWRGIPLKWAGRSKHPVPEAWLTVQARSSRRKRFVQSNRNATHPVNAMLNYAYGMLQSQVHIEVVAAGYDPRRGCMHHDREDADAVAFVFDCMEPGRPAVDEVVLRAVQRLALSGADFAVNSDGVCRLVPGLARYLASSVSELSQRIRFACSPWTQPF